MTPNWFPARAAIATAIAAAAVGCGDSPRHVSDPFSGGLKGARIVIDRVSCQPTPQKCARVVILAPVEITQTQLVRRIDQELEAVLGWRPTRFRQVVERDEGDAFDGRTSEHGGSVDPVVAELRYWQRTGWAREAPPDRDEVAILRAAQAAPTGVVVTIT